MIWVEEIQKRLAAATPGEWRVEDYRETGDWRSTGLIWAKTEEQYYSPGTPVCQIDCRKLHAASPEEKIKEFEANGSFIAHAPTDLKNLLAERELLREVLKSFIESPISFSEEDLKVLKEALSFDPTRKSEGK